MFLVEGLILFIKPVIAIIGRPNVGKSTLFNRLTSSRAALVSNQRGVTRDRNYGEGKIGKHSFIVIDTGGLDLKEHGAVFFQTMEQALQAIDEAKIVIFLVDARTGPQIQDYEIAYLLRKSNKKEVFLTVNKSDEINKAQISKSEFHELGLGDPYPISAEHGHGISNLLRVLFKNFRSEVQEEKHLPLENRNTNTRIKVAFVGRPNVGKSTLINLILRKKRVITDEKPGTTRDAIRIKFNIYNREYLFIDTAGMRRKSNISQSVEKFSIIKTIQAIKESHVVLLMLDGTDEIAEQDAHIADLIVESGKSLVLAMNKCEMLKNTQNEYFEQELRRKLYFLSFARVHKISALKDIGIRNLFRSIQSAYESAFINLTTSKLTRSLHAAIQRHSPCNRTNRCKMRYAHQGGKNPPLVIVHGNSLEKISSSYRRYLGRNFQREFRLEGTPLRVEFKSSNNPYVKE